LKFVIDASVVAKWFNNEALTDRALQVRTAFVEGRAELCAPEHLLYEVGNSIWKNRAFTANECAQAISDLVSMDIELARPDSGAAARTMKSARELSISYYDALYSQLSLDRGLPLLSADEKLISKSKDAIHLKDFADR